MKKFILKSIFTSCISFTLIYGDKATQKSMPIILPLGPAITTANLNAVVEPPMTHRVLPIQTLEIIQDILQALPTYIQNAQKDGINSLFSASELQALQKTLINFNNALTNVHNAIKPAAPSLMPISDLQMMHHIQMLLKALPWYMQEKDPAFASLDLLSLKKNLSEIYTKFRFGNKNPQNTLPSQSQGAIIPTNMIPSQSAPSIKSDKVIVTALPPAEYNEDEEEDYDGSIINEESPSPREDDPTYDESISIASLKNVRTIKVTNKEGSVILGTYIRTGNKEGNIIGKFTNKKGKTSLAIESKKGILTVKGASRKVFGYIHRKHDKAKKIVLYAYKAPKKASKK